jgi:flagellar L-ring protein precursor FlgH
MSARLFIASLVLATAALWPTTTFAQRSNLYQAQAPGGPSPMTLESRSWLYVQMPPVRELQINDLVTIVVDEKQQSQSEGLVNRIQQSNIDIRLRNWIMLDHFGIKAAPQTHGNPRARGSVDSQLRTNAELDVNSRMRFNITATIVDIRPNGNLVIEAHKVQTDNDETYEASLTGVVRREDVLPNNTIFSEKVAELSIHKRETGHIRDAYKRGWMLRIYDDFKPF